MPLHIACPSCEAVMAIPEGAGGQMVACPTCQKLMTLPSGPPPPVMARPAVAQAMPAGPPSGRSRRRDRDDSGDYEATRPRRLKTGPPSAEAYVVGTVSLIGNVIGTFCVIFGIIAAGIYERAKPRIDEREPVERDDDPFRRTPTPTYPFPVTGELGPSVRSRDPVPAPPEWIVLDFPTGHVRVMAPERFPSYSTLGLPNERRRSWGTNHNGSLRPSYTINVHTSETGGPIGFSAVERQILAALSAYIEKNAATPVRAETIRVGGQTQREYIIEAANSRLVMRLIDGGDQFMSAVVVTPLAVPPDDPRVLGFLDNVQKTN